MCARADTHARTHTHTHPFPLLLTPSVLPPNSHLLFFLRPNNKNNPAPWQLSQTLDMCTTERHKITRTVSRCQRRRSLWPGPPRAQWCWSGRRRHLAINPLFPLLPLRENTDDSLLGDNGRKQEERSTAVDKRRGEGGRGTQECSRHGATQKCSRHEMLSAWCRRHPRHALRLL